MFSNPSSAEPRCSANSLMRSLKIVLFSCSLMFQRFCDLKKVQKCKRKHHVGLIIKVEHFNVRISSFFQRCRLADLVDRLRHQCQDVPWHGLARGRHLWQNRRRQDPPRGKHQHWAKRSGNAMMTSSVFLTSFLKQTSDDKISFRVGLKLRSIKMFELDRIR